MSAVLPSTLGRPGAWLWGLLALVLSLAVAAVLAGTGTALWLLAAMAMAGSALAVWTRQPRRLLLAAYFVTLPLDISKAVLAPTPEGYYSPGLYVLPSQILGLMLLLVWLLHRAFVERRGLGLGRVEWLALVFLAWLWWAAWRSPQGALALASAASYTLFALSALGVARNIRDVEDLRLVVAVSAVMVLLEMVHVAAQVATRQQLLLPGSKDALGATIMNFGGEGSAFRPSGFFSHTNTLGHHVVAFLPVALSLVLLGRRHVAARPWWVALVVFLGGAAMLVLTLSRGGWVSAALGLLVLVFALLRLGVLNRRHLAGLALAALTGLVVAVSVYPQIILRLTGSDARSVEARVVQSDQAVAIIRANPALGVGFGAYNRASYQYRGPLWSTVSEDFQAQMHKVVVHNGYLLMAAELGLPGVLLFLLTFLAVARQLWPLRRWQDPVLLALGVGLTGSLAGQLLYVSSDNYYVDIRLMILWTTAGLMGAVVRLGTTPPAPAPVAAP